MNRPGRVLPHAAAALTTVLVAALLMLLPPPVAADTAPLNPSNPATPRTVAAQPLPTVQINGVVWSQVIVGNTVYVGGEFTRARPAGSPAGSNETVRSNLLAYNLSTGALVTTWAPSTNGTVNAIAAAPDGSRIYAGGTFTTVNGQTQRRIVALDPGTGAVISGFNPNPDAKVRAIVATSSTVYFGGGFSVVAGVSRGRLAAVRASDGALLSWAPRAADGDVWAMVLAPNNAQVLVGGSFLTVNGSSNPGYGLASIDPVSGALLPWAGAGVVRNAGDNAAITGLATDGDSAYVTGYAYSRGGNLEGSARMSWNGGRMIWLEDCHGDTYSVWPQGEAVYTASHKHYCGNIPGGFGQSSPWKYYRGNAFSRAATQTLMRDYLGYANWAGQPAPSLLHWLPRLDSGTYTGQYQGPWHVTGNDDYIIMGGEFPRVGNTAQQGLVRFGRSGATSGLETSASAITPKVRTTGAGQALVTWQTTWDRDNENLTYRVVRGSTTVETRTVASAEWIRPYQGFLDTGLTPGTQASYRIFVTDPGGNEVRSNSATVTVAGSGSAGAYATAVAEDGPQSYWRFSETSGSTVADYTGLENATASNVTRNVAGAIPGDAAATFAGSSSSAMANSTARHGEFWYSVEAWFRTTTTRGGKIVGYGSSRTGTSGTTDRHLYLDNSGRVNFGSLAGTSRRVLTSGGGLNNGQWHHAVGVVAKDGMSLYVDGTRVAFRSDTTVGGSYNGYWRVGGDNLSGWTNRPSSDYFAGSIDEVAVYTHALTAAEVSDHFAKATGGAGNQPPNAAFTATPNGLTVAFNSSGSSDPDGSVASRSWSFGDGGSSTATSPSHTYAAAGTYTVTLTVTDNDGATDSATQQVTVTAPPVGNEPPTAAFTVNQSDLTINVNGSGSDDPDGTVTAYSWSWGDGTPAGSGATASHTYAAAGTYTVTLTVTDDDGATGTTTRSVTVSTGGPQQAVALDTFGRTVGSGWGSAEVGGPWSATGTLSRWSVSGGKGRFTMPAGAGAWNRLGSVSVRDLEGTLDFGIDKAITTGYYASTAVRRVGTSEYQFRTRFLSGGTVRVWIARVVNGAETQLGAAYDVPGLTYAAGDVLRMRFRVSGAPTATLSLTVWKVGQPEPAVQVTRTDSTAALQGAGALGIYSYLPSSATNAPVVATFDDLEVLPLG